MLPLLDTPVTNPECWTRMKQTDLCHGWEFTLADKGCGYYRPHLHAMPWLPAEVPGHVHLDLARNGIIAHPFSRLADFGAQWVDEVDWTYHTEFEWAPTPGLPRRVLQFEGLDTVCEVWLNGALAATHDSMFVPLEVDVTDRLETGKNRLEVRFMSAVRVGDARRTAYFEQEGLGKETTFFDERAFVRKAQYMSGWDWGPRLVSCGIWQPVRLLEFAGRLNSASFVSEPMGGRRFRVHLQALTEGEGELSARFMGIPGTEWEVEAPLWQPNGYGEPVLHAASVSFAGHQIEKRVGLKTVELVRERDRFGESFEFVVNGHRVWARGANWIPHHSFPSQVTAADYRASIGRCRDLNFNMLRVWGGGLYELEAFYDACDESGILVWQDFPFACSYYPDDAAHQAIVRAEAEHHVRRLRDRASLALWCGNNENETMWEGKWGPAEHQPPRYYGDSLYTGTLPEVVARLNPAIPYIPTSPMGKAPDDVATEESRNVNMGGWGDQHYWDAWHGRGDWIHYADSKARFSSEFGFASSCSMETWEQWTDEAERTTFPTKAVLAHDRTNKGWDKFFGYVALHYPAAQTLSEWVEYSQLNQRDALRFAIEHYRRSEFCRGSLIWQWNDCWPAMSWAVEDFSRKLKPAGSELRRLYAPTMIAVDQREREIDFWVVHDGTSTIETQLSVYAPSERLEGPLFASAKLVLEPSQRVLVLTVDIDQVDLGVNELEARLDGIEGSERFVPLKSRNGKGGSI